MKSTKKTTNILLRVNDLEKSSISIKSRLFNRKISDYLRHTAFSHWEDISSTKHFKTLLKIYQEGDDIAKKEIVEILFQFYRRNGFPYTVLTDDEKINRMDRIIKSKSILLEDDHLQMNLQGIDLANSYHPHMMEAYYKRGENSPYQTYSNDDGLKDCINRWMELDKIPNPAGMRRILKTRDKTRGVVNFKPTVAKYIYDSYCSRDGKVLDPCAGYSGRLAGCIAANKGLFYHGIDPNGATAVGNMEMASFFSGQYNALGGRVYNYKFRFDLGCAEEVMSGLNDSEYDLIFSSPPYFDTEVYSEDSSQSGNRYDAYKEWSGKFLFKIVHEGYRVLKNGGYLVLNVKNFHDKKIADDLLGYCNERWSLHKTYHMRLANNVYDRRNGESFHTEPIFVFKKKRAEELIKAGELY